MRNKFVLHVPQTGEYPFSKLLCGKLGYEKKDHVMAYLQKIPNGTYKIERYSKKSKCYKSGMIKITGNAIHWYQVTSTKR